MAGSRFYLGRPQKKPVFMAGGSQAAGVAGSVANEAYLGPGLGAVSAGSTGTAGSRPLDGRSATGTGGGRGRRCRRRG